MPQLGDTLRFRADLYDKPVEDGGVLVNAASAALVITKPDGTVVTPAPTISTPATTGKYLYDYTTTVGGLTGTYRGSWLFTFAGGATTAYQESFEVSASLVTLDEVTAHLRAAGVLTRDADLEQLEWLAAVATDAIERDLDRALVLRTTTELYDGTCGRAVVLKRAPVIAVTTVKVNTLTLTGGEGTDWTTRKGAGILYRGSSTSCAVWSRGVQNVEVTAQVGEVNPAPVARKVALNAVERMWQTSQQAGHPLIDDVAADAAVFAAVAGSLTPIEQAGYNNLRRGGGVGVA